MPNWTGRDKVEATLEELERLVTAGIPFQEALNKLKARSVHKSVADIEIGPNGTITPTFKEVE